MDFSETGRALLEGLPFNQLIGMKVPEVKDGSGSAVLPDRDEVKNHVGTQHAGALFTCAETAAGAAIVGSFGHMLGELTPLAKTATISYLKPAIGPITARATLVEPKDEVLATFAREGKAQCTVAVSVRNEDDVEVVTMSIVWFLRKNR